MLRFRAYLALAALLAAFWGTPAAATMADALSMGELVERADRIALVRVTSQVARYDGRGRIVTDVTVEVERGILAAETGDVFDLVSLGGIVEDIGMRIEGEPQFENGSRVIVFVRHVNGIYRPVGMSQGVLPVLEGEIPTVAPGGSGLTLVEPNTQGRLVPAGAALRGVRSLDGVLDRVQSLVDAR